MQTNPEETVSSKQHRSRGERIFAWFDERYELTGIIEFMKHKKVPVHHESVWYYLGGVTLFFFIIQVVTGIMLLVYYRAGEAEAYESVKFIITEVKFGWLIRSIHSWAANLMVLFAFIHMFSVFFTKAHRKPRELTWLSGMVLFLLLLAFGFSGYLLPWDELAFFATKVGTDIVGAVPFAGEALLEFLRGGPDVTGATLSRFFGLHAAILPAVFTVILALHLAFVQKQGMSEPEHWGELADREKKYMPFFPNFFLRDALFWLIVLNILAILAVFFPWELGPKADAFAPAPAGIQPEWFFMFMFETLKYIPPHVLFIEGETLGVLMFAIGGILWCLIPFWDKETPGGKRGRIITYIGIGVVIYIVVFTILGYTVG